MPTRDVILHFGYDKLLTEARTVILEDAGYEVTVADSPAAVLRAMRARQVALVLVCHSVPPEELAETVDGAKRISPRVPVIVVHVGGLTQPQRPVADGFIDGLRGPEHLIGQVAAAIARSGRRRPRPGPGKSAGSSSAAH